MASAGGEMMRPPPVEGIPAAGVTSIVLFAVFSCFLSVLAVGLRFWARKLKNTSLAWNDWAAVIGLILSIGLGAGTTEAVVNADLGAHVYELPDPPVMIVHNLKSLISYQITWSGANTFARLSILHLYVTIFRTPQFRLAARILMGVAVAFWIAVILQTFLFCTPFEANWDQTIPGAHCGNIRTEGICTGTFNLAIDFAIVCLPMPALWNLQLAMRKKVVLVFIFGIGFFICALSIVRLQSLATLGPDSDLTYDLNHIAWWSILENSLSVINCCLPVLQPVVSKVAGSRALSRARSTYGSRAYGSQPLGSKSYADGSIQVTTEHKVEHMSSDNDDGIPLQNTHGGPWARGATSHSEDNSMPHAV